MQRPAAGPDPAGELLALPPSALREDYLGFVRRHGADACRREGGPEHLTASCFVFDPPLERTLLCLHGKGRFWVQFGGHVEPGDRSLAAAARRELREESGLQQVELIRPVPVDLDRHTLGGGFSCAVHWDVGFVAIGRPDDELAASAESLAVRWFDLDALPSVVPPGFTARLGAVLSSASARRP